MADAEQRQPGKWKRLWNLNFDNTYTQENNGSDSTYTPSQLS